MNLNPRTCLALLRGEGIFSILSNLIACGGSNSVTNGFLGVSYEKNARGEWVKALSGDLTGTIDYESSLSFTMQCLEYIFFVLNENFEKSYWLYYSGLFLLLFRVELKSKVFFIPKVWFLLRGNLLPLLRIDNFLLVRSDCFGMEIVYGRWDKDPLVVYSAVIIVFFRDGTCFKYELVDRVVY